MPGNFAFILFALLIVSHCPRAHAQGSLLLNMLTRDEESNLARTLPRWAKIIDCYIIGVDVLNKPSDRSEQIIRHELRGIPGVVVKINFEGMGPSWSKLIEAGRQHCPNITHGILADADFSPINLDWDKRELDTMCSKHSFKIWTEDRLNERTLDWVYRNIEGAVVKRRTHQTLEVPPILGQQAYQTMISLSIEESSGYGDRAGGKNERYIQLLKDDLAELPDDPRTLYYLGFAHFDIFNKHQENPTPADWATLEDSVKYYRRRVGIVDKGYYEERYFAMIKLGEIFERFYKNITEAVKYYKMASELDGERADAWFYWGQIYRLNKEYDKAFDPLLRAASTPLPVRALFQWRYLYDCLAPIELARAVVFHPNPTPAMWASALPLLHKGASGCKGSEQAEIEADVRLIENKLGTKACAK